MLKHHYILLFLYAGGFIAGSYGDWEDEVDKIIDNVNTGNGAGIASAISTLNAQAPSYNPATDKSIPTSNLKAAIDNLYEKQGKYRGSAADDLLDIQQESDKLIDKNRRTNNKGFRWAVMGRQRLNFIVQHQDSFNSSELIRKFTQDILTNGVSTIDAAIEEYRNIEESFRPIKHKSRTIKDRLQADRRTFNAKFDEYERNRTQYNLWLQRYQTQTANQLADCERLYSRQRSVSCANQVYEKTKADGTKEMPSKEGKRQILNGVYDVLLPALDNLINELEAVRTAIESEISYISKLKDRAIDPTYAAQESTTKQIVDYLDKFASKLDEYVKRHSGGAIVDFDTNNRFIDAKNE